jgi:LPS sulfotransferase NodH
VPPHFHAIYAQYDAAISVDPIEVMQGNMPQQAQSLVFEWAARYQNELRANWELTRAGQPLQRIPPLD